MIAVFFPVALSHSFTHQVPSTTTTLYSLLALVQILSLDFGFSYELTD